jgi:uncharacterized protein (TIGR00255 family)
LGDGEIVVSLKSVNHRGLDIHIHAPSVADAFENAIRGAIKGKVSRGHVEVRISLPKDSPAGSKPSLNEALLEEYIQAFRAAASRHKLDTSLDLNAALRVPGVFGEGDEKEPPPGTETALTEALEAAVTELNSFREREGAEIALEMKRHNTHVSSAALEMEHLRTGAAPAFQKRLEERLAELLRGIQIEPQRLAQEAAIIADRSDIGEELARLKIHSSQLAGLLAGGGEVGKKLDFLLQEMNRETNTILSKTNGAGEIGMRITELALGAKSAIEKIREQSLNLE